MVSGKDELSVTTSDVLAASDSERANGPTAKLSEVADESGRAFATEIAPETLSAVLAASDSDSETVNPPIALSDVVTLSDSDSDIVASCSVNESDVLILSDRDRA